MININKESCMPIITEAENQYFKTHGRYAQMLSSNGNGRPGDQKEGWADLCVLPEMQTEVCIDVYEGPKGHGYIIRHIKDKQESAIEYGPEQRHSFDWRVINEF